MKKIIEEHGRLFTTKRNKEQHGYGISNVKKILESYHGIIDFNHTKDVFRVDTALYCKPSEA
ncbi:MAG: GHKL domain-containing protein [Oscillospiraceae bacterium]|nr:GHKL domain-containing protein [Oscillospiraceae bacterium]